MALQNKILTRLDNLATEIVGKINSKITSHNSSETAHGSLFVKTVDKSNHPHGLISKDGKITSTTTNVSKVVVAENDGTLKTIQKVPSENVVHQDLSSKLNKNQGTSNSGKFMKVQSTGEVAPESITIPEVSVNQKKTNGVEIGSINGVKLYCNENTTYNNATTALSGLMSKEDKAKLDGIKEGADNVTFSRTLNSGIEIGKLKINNDEIILYCSNTTQYGEATQDHSGLMSVDDKKKLDGIAPLADDVSFTRVLTSGTKIGTIKIGSQTTDIYCSTPKTYGVVESSGLTLNSDNNFKHTNSVSARTAESLCKIKYDAQGHITGSTPIAQADITNLGISESTHEHGWQQIELLSEGRGVLYVNETIKLAAFYWSGNDSTGYVSKGNHSINTIPGKYRPKYRVSTHINVNPSQPIVLYVKGRGETSQPGQVWYYSSMDNGNYYIASSLMWTYGI